MDLTLLTAILVGLLGLLLLRPLGALVVLPEGQQRSGSIGGTTWSHNRSGVYIRNRSIPVNPNSDRQVTIRNAVRNLAIDWNDTLTPAQRNSWDVYAANVTWVNRLGQTISLTGLNHFIRSNSIRIQGGQAQVDDGPTFFTLASAETSLSVTASEATQQYTVAYNDTKPWVSTDGAFEFFWAGLPQNASRKFFGGPYRAAGGVSGDAGVPPVSPQIVPAPFPFAEGQRLWFRTRITYSDGRLSELAQVNFLGLA